MNKYLFEYVLSGMDYPRQVSAYEGNILDPEHKAMFTAAMKDIYSKLKGDGFKLSLLFNALTEISYIPYTQEMKGSLYKVHADSGGLQMVTQNLSVDAQGKRDIYDRQGKFSDVAMSYDSIPVINTSSGNSKNAENKTKVIDDGNLKRYAEETAQSFMEQFLYFFQKGYKSTPYLIIHGYDHASYSSWYNIVMDYLPNEIVDNLGGIAIGGAGLNSGEYLEIEKAMFLSEITNVDHVHLLGVGSPTKAAIHASYLMANKYQFELSADSTTHTSSLSRGAAIINGRAKHLKHVGVFDAVEEYALTHLGDIMAKYNIKIARNLAYESISVASKRDDVTQQLLLEMFLTSMIVVIFSVHNFFQYSVDTDDTRIGILRKILESGDPKDERTYLKQKFKYNKIKRSSDEANSLAQLI